MSAHYNIFFSSGILIHFVQAKPNMHYNNDFRLRARTLLQDSENLWLGVGATLNCNLAMPLYNGLTSKLLSVIVCGNKMQGVITSINIIYYWIFENFDFKYNIANTMLNSKHIFGVVFFLFCCKTKTISQYLTEYYRFKL